MNYSDQIVHAVVCMIAWAIGAPLLSLVWRGLIVLPLYSATFYWCPHGRFRNWLLGLFYYGPSRQNQELAPRWSWKDKPYYGQGSGRVPVEKDVGPTG
jgi:hypothetical protein